MEFFKRNKYNNKPVILQILDLIPHWLFKSCTDTYQTDEGVSKYRVVDLFIALTFGQRNKCQSTHLLSSLY